MIAENETLSEFEYGSQDSPILWANIEDSGNSLQPIEPPPDISFSPRVSQMQSFNILSQVDTFCVDTPNTLKSEHSVAKDTGKENAEVTTIIRKLPKWQSRHSLEETFCSAEMRILLRVAGNKASSSDSKAALADKLLLCLHRGDLSKWTVNKHSNSTSLASTRSISPPESLQKQNRITQVVTSTKECQEYSMEPKSVTSFSGPSGNLSETGPTLSTSTEQEEQPLNVLLSKQPTFRPPSTRHSSVGARKSMGGSTMNKPTPSSIADNPVQEKSAGESHHQSTRIRTMTVIFREQDYKRTGKVPGNETEGKLSVHRSTALNMLRESDIYSRIPAETDRSDCNQCAETGTFIAPVTLGSSSNTSAHKFPGAMGPRNVEWRPCSDGLKSLLKFCDLLNSSCDAAGVYPLLRSLEDYYRTRSQNTPTSHNTSHSGAAAKWAMAITDNTSTDHQFPERNQRMHKKAKIAAPPWRNCCAIPDSMLEPFRSQLLQHQFRHIPHKGDSQSESLGTLPLAMKTVTLLREGRLGISLHQTCTTSGIMAIQVQAKHFDLSSAPGSCVDDMRQIAHLLCVGDELVSINGTSLNRVFAVKATSTSEFSVQQNNEASGLLQRVIHIIRNAPRPLVLGFASGGNSA